MSVSGIPNNPVDLIIQSIQSNMQPFKAGVPATGLRTWRLRDVSAQKASLSLPQDVQQIGQSGTLSAESSTSNASSVSIKRLAEA